MIPQPPTDPVDLTPPEFAALPVVRRTAQTLDQVAAMVAGHDGAGRAEIALEGTDFRVTLGPRRPLVYEFSEKDKRKLSETERAELLARWDRNLFTSARDWAVRELRALPKGMRRKGMRRKVHPPRKVAPAAGEVEQLRRQLEDARGALSVARRELDIARKGWGAEKEQRATLRNELEAATARLQVLEAAGDAAVQAQRVQDIERLEEKNEELEGRVRELETELESAASEAAAQGHAEGREEVLLELGVHDDLTLADRLELEGILSAFEERRRSVRPMSESVRAGEAGTESVVEELRARVGHLVTIVRTLTTASEGGPMDDETEEKALFLIRNWGDLPLAALRWVVEENRRA